MTTLEITLIILLTALLSFIAGACWNISVHNDAQTKQIEETGLLVIGGRTFTAQESRSDGRRTGPAGGLAQGAAAGEEREVERGLVQGARVDRAAAGEAVRACD